MKGTIFKTTAASLALITTLFAATSCANASATNETAPGTQAPEAGKHYYSIINVSYDPTRELYAAYNEAFKKHWESEHDSTVEITQSHGGSGKQAPEVAN